MFEIFTNVCTNCNLNFFSFKLIYRHWSRNLYSSSERERIKEPGQEIFPPQYSSLCWVFWWKVFDLCTLRGPLAVYWRIHNVLILLTKVVPLSLEDGLVRCSFKYGNLPFKWRFESWSSYRFTPSFTFSWNHLLVDERRLIRGGVRGFLQVDRLIQINDVWSRNPRPGMSWVSSPMSLKKRVSSQSWGVKSLIRVIMKWDYVSSTLSCITWKSYYGITNPN